MKFGVFYEHQLPRPWEEDSEYRILQDALEQVELADRLGFDVVWEVEHHFLEEYSHSSAPEVFLGACSQRTKDIRLGHGIIQTAPGYNHPARTAERVATDFPDGVWFVDLTSAQDGAVSFVGNTFSGSAPGGLLGMSAPGEVINNTFTGTTSVDVGLNEAGVTVTGNTFNNTPSQAYFSGNGSYDPKTIEANNSFPNQGEIYIIQNGIRQDGVYSSIQAAIDAAIPGDTVFVGNGTYNQNVALANGVNVDAAAEDPA